jgi:hypothetical protein
MKMPFRWIAAPRVGGMLAAIGLLASAAPAQAAGTCSASGVMAGESFSLAHCAAAFLPGENSVTLWFNEQPISPDEQATFEMSAYALNIANGRERTMVLVAFCPGGGATTASAGGVKSIDMGLSHAKSAMAGRQWVLGAPQDFKVEQIAGEVVPGGKLSGRITGKRASEGPYTWDLKFDVTLPTQEAASGVTCAK